MPELPRINRGPVDFGRRATPQDFGAGVAAERAQTGAIVGQIGGAVADQTDRILQASQQAKLARATAEFSASDAQRRFDLQSDPDLDTQEERYEKATKEALDQAKAALPSQLHGQFEDRIFPARAHGQIELRRQIRGKRIEGAQADLQETARLRESEAAQARDPVRREQIRGQFHGQVDQQVGTILSPAQADKMKLDFDRGVSLSDIRRTIREDPVAAYNRLSEPGDPIAQGYDQAEIEAFRTQALDEHRQRLQERRAAAAAARAEQERAEREAGEESTRQLYDLLDAGGTQQLDAFLRANRSTLPVDRYRFGLERLEQGGGFGNARTNPGVYLSLSRSAAQGLPIRDVLDQAVVRGELAKTDRDRLLKVTEDLRFRAAVDHLQAKTKPGPLQRFEPGTAERAADMERSLTDWIIAHPDATREEAFAQADVIIRNFGTGEMSRLEQPQFSPPPAAGAKLDLNAAEAVLRQKLDAGEITMEQLDQELERIEALRSAQSLAEIPK